jgi:hypothetical protein
MPERYYAMLDAQGTACAETTLTAEEFADPARVRSAESRARHTTGPDAPVPGTWTDVSDNDAVIAYMEDD